MTQAPIRYTGPGWAPFTLKLGQRVRAHPSAECLCPRCGNPMHFAITDQQNQRFADILDDDVFTVVQPPPINMRCWNCRRDIDTFWHYGLKHLASGQLIALAISEIEPVL